MERRLGSRRSAQYSARDRHLSARRVRRPAAEGAKPATAPKDLVADRCRRRDDRARSALGLQFPIVKNIWTSSYVLVCGGLSALLLGVFHQVIDAWERRSWPTIFI